jgi:ribosomal protein S18 acetylase RimI-like enzyme
MRPLTREDEPVLWEMLYLALHVPEGQPPFPREVLQAPGIRHYVEGWGRPGDMGVLALDGETPVGAAWLRLLTGEDRGFGYVDDETPELSIAVMPEYRGRGIGSEMLRRLLEIAGSRYTAVSLSVSADNPARRLYERFGFRVVRDDGSSLTMVRPY